MATTEYPILVAGGIGSGPRIWMLASTEVTAALDASAFLTNGYKAGMRQGDLMFHYSSSTLAWTAHTVLASGTTIDLSDGTVIGSTSNTD